MRGERVPDLVRHVGGEAADRGEAVGLAHALLHLLDAGEILADADEPGHVTVARAERPEGDADRHLLPVAPSQPELVARRRLAAFRHRAPYVVETHAVAEDRLPRLVDRLVRPHPGDGLGRAVERGDTSGRVHADEPGADRFEDQVAERLEVRQVLSLILHVLLELVIAIGEGAGDDGHEQENARVHEHGQELDRGVLGRRRRSRASAGWSDPRPGARRAGCTSPRRRSRPPGTGRSRRPPPAGRRAG